jgi:hypothetical protein
MLLLFHLYFLKLNSEGKKIVLLLQFHSSCMISSSKATLRDKRYGTVDSIAVIGFYMVGVSFYVQWLTQIWYH